MEANKKTKVTIETIDPTGDAADRFEAEEFAGRVKQHLMQGRASWQKAREPGERVLPRSLRTGKLYTDYNSAYLSTVAEERGFRDVRWGTREQIEDQGGRIRDGEQGESLPGRTPTSEPRGLKVDMGGDSLKELYSDDYARRALIEARSTPVDPHTVYRVGFVGEDGTTDWSSAGSNKEEADRIAGDYLKSGRVPPDALPGASYSAVTKVYNAEQTDGLPAPEHSRSEPLWKAHQRAEDIIRSAGVGVRHTDGDAVSYSVELDEIKIPKKERFASATDYYRTAIKQLGHAAAHPARMGTQGRRPLCRSHRPRLGAKPGPRLRTRGAAGRDGRKHDLRADRPGLYAPGHRETGAENPRARLGSHRAERGRLRGTEDLRPSGRRRAGSRCNPGAKLSFPGRNRASAISSLHPFPSPTKGCQSRAAPPAKRRTHSVKSSPLPLFWSWCR